MEPPDDTGTGYDAWDGRAGPRTGPVASEPAGEQHAPEATLDDALTLLCVRCRAIVVDRAELYHCRTRTGLCICVACWRLVTSTPPVGPRDLARAVALVEEG